MVHKREGPVKCEYVPQKGMDDYVLVKSIKMHKYLS